MAKTLTLLLIALIGCLVGFIFNDRLNMHLLDISLQITLYTLLFGIGLSVAGTAIPKLSWRATSIGLIGMPLAVVCATMLAAGLVASISGKALVEVIAASSGYGFYSAAAAIAGANGYSELAIVSFVTNAFWEILALIFIPVIAGRMGREASVASAGATAMDVALPTLSRENGPTVIQLALLCGLSLTLLAPLMTTFWIALL